VRTIYGTEGLDPERFRNPVVTLGVFDGIHRGHRAVLARTREMAARRNGEVVVLTFDVHPRKVTTGRPPPLITSLEHRLLLLAREGVDVTIVLQFDEALRQTAAEDFVQDVLLGGIGAVGVVLGHDSHFGLNRRGNVALVRRMLEPRDIPVEDTEPVTLTDGTVVSSSAIRAAVAAGDLEDAARLLGRPPALYGIVVRGDRRGRQLGFPTANLDMRHELRPGRGVYGGKTAIDGVTWPAVVNIGGRPTFSPEEDEDTVEVHVLGYDGDLYGRALEVTLFDKLRDEARFDGPDALRDQITRDCLDLLGRVRERTWSLA
jgi:riboflavin kinase/FMN adenylyltransferase